MLFLINAIFLFFVSLGAQPQVNPLNVTLTLEKHVDENGEKQTIKVDVLSSSKNKEKYYLTIELPASSIKTNDAKDTAGKNFYSGSLEPMDSNDFFIDIEPVGEGKGQIKTSIYKYLDNQKTDSANVKNQSFDYSVVKDDNDKYLVYISNNASNQNSPGVVGSGILELNSPEAVTDSKIIINEDSRRNNFLRYFLFVLSFFVIGHLVYRIVRED